MSVPIRIPPKQDFIKYTGPMQFSSEVAGSQTFLGSNAPVYTENTSLDDLLKLQELYSSKSSGSIFNPRGRVYSNLNRKLQSQLDKKDPIRAKSKYLRFMGGYGEDYAKMRGIYNAAPAELFVQGQEDALAAYVDEQKAILYPPKKPPVPKFVRPVVGIVTQTSGFPSGPKITELDGITLRPTAGQKTKKKLHLKT